MDPELIDAARRTFARHGYGGATLERIAEEAGISRVTLHRRGIGKDDLLEALAQAATERYRRTLWPALTGAGSGRERLERALEALLDVAEAEMALLLALRSRTDALFHEPGEEALTRDVFTEPLERLLRDGAADGSLRTDLDPREAATVLFNAAGWTYVHLRSGHGWSARRARRATLDLVTRGVLP